MAGSLDCYQTKYLIYGADGTPANNDYIYPGFVASAAAVNQIVIPDVSIIIGVYVKCQTAPGGVVVDTFTVYIAGGATAAAATVTGAATVGAWTGQVAVAAMSLLGLRFTTSGATAIVDPMITIKLQQSCGA